MATISLDYFRDIYAGEAYTDIALIAVAGIEITCYLLKSS